MTWRLVEAAHDDAMLENLMREAGTPVEEIVQFWEMIDARDGRAQVHTFDRETP